MFRLPETAARANEQDVILDSGLRGAASPQWDGTLLVRGRLAAVRLGGRLRKTVLRNRAACYWLDA
jgi:hypothetical protein